MKYIRTKDGVFKVGDRETNICILTNHGYIYKQDIVKQSDAIEELCDYEMHYDNNGEFVIRPIKHVDWQSLKRVIINKWFKDCKLAIKTDKGLIYVAKMNESGVIELL